MANIIPINPYSEYRYFTTSVTIHNKKNRTNQNLDKKYALIGIRNTISRKSKVHPVTEFIIFGENINHKYLTMKKYADHVVSFLNFVYIQNYQYYKIRHYSELKFSHGVDFLNFKGSTNSRKTVERYESTIKHFYYYLATKKVTKYFTKSSFIIVKIIINNKPKMFIKSPFHGVVYPADKFTSKRMHDFPDELVIHFLLEINRVTPIIAFGVYLLFFGGIRIGELVNLKKSSIRTIGIYGQDGMIIKIESHNQREDLHDSLCFDGVKVEREQSIIPIPGLIDALYRNHIEKYSSFHDNNSLFTNTFGKPMTSDSFRYYFNKGKQSFINKLVHHSSQSVRDAGLNLRYENWSTHIGRGKFSHIVSEDADNPFETMRARGDKSIDSVIDYICNSPKIRQKIIDAYSELFSKAIKKPL